MNVKIPFPHISSPDSWKMMALGRIQACQGLPGIWNELLSEWASSQSNLLDQCPISFLMKAIKCKLSVPQVVYRLAGNQAYKRKIKTSPVVPRSLTFTNILVPPIVKNPCSSLPALATGRSRVHCLCVTFRKKMMEMDRARHHHGKWWYISLVINRQYSRLGKNQFLWANFVRKRTGGGTLKFLIKKQLLQLAKRSLVIRKGKTRIWLCAPFASIVCGRVCKQNKQTIEKIILLYGRLKFWIYDLSWL